jgi:hypothetical protein
VSGSRLRTSIPVIALAGLFLFGLIRLFVLRFEAGDVYPPYSSLRSDPLGIQVLYESVHALRPDGIQRSYVPLERIVFADGQAVLVCGLPPDTRLMETTGWEKMLTALSSGGGRLIVTFTGRPSHDAPADDDAGPADRSGDDAPEGLPNDSSDDLRKDASRDGNDASTGLGIALKAVVHDVDNRFAVRTEEPSAASLPDTIAWFGSHGFVLDDPQWQTIYRYQNEPVIVTRPWGRGQVTLVADSYLLSNEALRRNRLSDLLAWIAMAEPHLLVDEAHHGLLKQPGVAALARKYRLHGVFAVLVAVAILFIWQRAAVFVPPEGTRRGDAALGPAIGRDTADGLVHLMGQHIPSRSLPTVCFEAWRSGAAASRLGDEMIARVRECAVDPEAGGLPVDPVTRYQRICELLK